MIFIVRGEMITEDGNRPFRNSDAIPTKAFSSGEAFQ